MVGVQSILRSVYTGNNTCQQRKIIPRNKTGGLREWIAEDKEKNLRKKKGMQSKTRREKTGDKLLREWGADIWI